MCEMRESGITAAHARDRAEHGMREHGVLGRLLATRSVLSIGLAPSFVFRCWGFLAPRLADCEPLDPRIGDDCVCGFSLSLSLARSLALSPSPSVRPSLMTRTRRCCTNLTRFRWLFVSSSIAETVDDGDRPACPRRNGSPDRPEFKGRAFACSVSFPLARSRRDQGIPSLSLPTAAHLPPRLSPLFR